MGRKLVDAGWRARQHIVSAVLTLTEEAEFSRISKALGLTRSSAIRQLVKGVISGKTVLEANQKTHHLLTSLKGKSHVQS